MLPYFLNPKTLLNTLEDIDNSPPSYASSGAGSSYQAIFIILSVCLSLLLLDHLKNTNALIFLLQQFSLLFGFDAKAPVTILTNSQYGEIIRQAWWTFAHIVSYFVIPFIVIKVFLKQKVRDFGWRWGDTHHYLGSYFYLLCPIVIIIIFASQRQDFTNQYPFYSQAQRSWLDFITWELLYLIQFICLEFFYRGFMVQSLRPHFGSASIGVMLIPYLMIHFGKPWMEATGAIFFGLILGILALRSRSFWGSLFVHAVMAVGVDIASLLQKGHMPLRLLP